LVDEVAMLIHPHLVGSITPRSCFRAPDLTSEEGVIQLKLAELERLENDLVWVLYEVIRQ
jgi:riboflavin biosynthesis pyrimidine reductase